MCTCAYLWMCRDCISSAYVRAVTVEINSSFQCIKKAIKFATCGCNVRGNTRTECIRLQAMDIG